MALQYSPRLITDGLVMCLDPSQNKSYPTSDLPVKNGLLLWLDASDDSTFSYSSGTEVSQWRDKSGNNFHANELQAVGNKPSRNTVVNGRKSLNFTSTEGDRLRVNSGMVFTNSVTAIVFIKPGSQNYAYANILDQDHAMSGQANGWVIQRNNVSSAWQSWVSNSAGDNWFNPNQVSYTDNTPQIVTLRKGSSTITLYNNGTTSGDVSVADQQIRQANYFGLNIGSWRAGGFSDRHYNGEICEIVIYNRALSLTELKQVHTYLGQKWGISNTDRSIVDLSNNNNHGLLGGVAGSQVVADMPLFDVYNKGALKLDGSTDYIAVENATSLNPTTVTVSIWVKRNGYQSQTANYLRRNYNDAYGILGDIAADSVRFRIYNGSAYPESPNATLSLNEWTNIVGTYDLANIKIYKNGVFVGQTAHTSAISYASANTTLTIGRDDPVAGRYMNANYGSVLIYSRALSAAEVLQNYEAQKSKFANTIVQQGLVLNLDAGNIYSYAGAGTVWYDVSGTGNNGTLTNGPTYTSDNSGGILFDGSDDYVNVTYNASTISFPSNNATICVWFKVSTTGDGIGVLVTQRSSSGSGFQTYMYSTRLYADGGGTAGVSSNTVISNGTISFGCIVYDRTNSLLKLYINGIFDNQVSYTGNIQDTYPIRLGNGAFGDGPFPGTIYMAQIYNRTLSAAEVLQNYNATKGRFGL
jgi:hypothetical protein